MIDFIHLFLSDIVLLLINVDIINKAIILRTFCGYLIIHKSISYTQ